MIFIGFVIFTSILLLFAHIGGSVGYFVNLDSIALVIIPGILFSIFTFKWKEYVDGIKLLFCFNKKSIRQNNKTASLFKSLIYVTIGFGFLSAAQGLFSYILARRDYSQSVIELSEFSLNTTFAEACVYASFTIVYAVLISAFLFYPVHLLKKTDD